MKTETSYSSFYSEHLAIAGSFVMAHWSLGGMKVWFSDKVSVDIPELYQQALWKWACGKVNSHGFARTDKTVVNFTEAKAVMAHEVNRDLVATVHFKDGLKVTVSDPLLVAAVSEAALKYEIKP